MLQSNWTPQSLGTKVLGWFREVDEVGGHQPNKMIGASDYLTVVSGSGLNKVYTLPNTTPYKNADTDYCWWRTDASLSVTDGNRLIAYDFARTIVKYDSVSPYTLRETIILASGATLTTDEMNSLANYCKISPWWSGSWYDYGQVKENRNFEYVAWTAENVAPPIPTGLTLSLIAAYGGVKVDWTDGSGGTAQTEVWGGNSSGGESLLYTIAIGVSTKNDTGVTPVDLRYYKIRALKNGQYSEFTNGISIAMLGSEKISNVTFDNSAGWTLWNTTISGGVMHLTGDAWAASSSIVAATTGGKKYRFKWDCNYVSGRVIVYNDSAMSPGVYFLATETNKIVFSTPNSSGTTISFIVDTNGTSLTVDNFSLKEVLT